MTVQRAWAFNAEKTEMTLIEVGEKALYFGHLLPEGRMIARQAWAYEYRLPYVLGRVEQCGLAHYQPQRNHKAAKAAPAPVQRPRKTAKAPAVSAPAATLAEPQTWRSDRLVAAIANPY